MMLIYDSLTGNVRRFVAKLGMDNVPITDGLVVRDPFILVTYTIGMGQVPPTTLRFLERSSEYMLGVAVSGNRNWGSTFAAAADKISHQFQVPILHKFELAGTVGDVGIFSREVGFIVQQHSKMDQSQ